LQKKEKNTGGGGGGVGPLTKEGGPSAVLGEMKRI